MTSILNPLVDALLVTYGDAIDRTSDRLRAIVHSPDYRDSAEVNALAYAIDDYRVRMTRLLVVSRCLRQRGKGLTQ